MKQTLVIEKNIPIPSRRVRNGFYHNALEKMKIGDSFLIPKGMPRASVYLTAKRVGAKICIRTVEGRLRVWRIK